jgi:hypothetical protein
MKKSAGKSRYADILAVERKVKDGVHSTEVRVDMGGGDTGTAEHVADVGDDSCPIPGIDEATVTESSGSGNVQAIGYSSPASEPKTAPGEKRLYVRDEEGTLVAELWLKHDEAVIEAFKADYPIRIKTTGPVILDSPDVRLSDAAGNDVARVGDMVIGSFRALSAAPGSLVVPVPPATPTPTGGVGFVGKITSGQPKVKA